MEGRKKKSDMFVFFKPASAESEELFVFPQFFFPLPPSEQRETLLCFQGLRQGLSCVKSTNVHRLPEQEGMLKKKSHPPKKKSENKWWRTGRKPAAPYTKNHYGDSNQGAPRAGGGGVDWKREAGEIDESSLTLDGCN